MALFNKECIEVKDLTNKTIVDLRLWVKKYTNFEEAL